VSDTPPAPRVPRLPLAEWPAADAAAWQLACTPGAGPFSRNPARSRATYTMYADGYAGWLWHLRSLNQLHPAETPAERVTRERLGSYHERLARAGLADHTIVARFEGLRGALRLMYPGGDFTFITRPGNVSVRRKLRMHRRPRFVPDSREAELWAETLFIEALSLPVPAERQRQVRDAAFIGMMASRGPRRRAAVGMRLGHNLRRVGDHWELFFDASLMKGGRSSLQLPLGPRVGRIFTRYIEVERRELLQGATHDFVWVAKSGDPWSDKGTDFMMRTRTKARFGVAFGSHRFRTSLTTTQAIVDGRNLLGTSRILAHSPAVALKHYNRAGSLEASRRHDAYMDEAEDAAARMLRQRAPNPYEPRSVQALHDLKQTHKHPRRHQ
jgi:integrase/recombinase XerD